jgi:hypothetical protein
MDINFPNPPQNAYSQMTYTSDGRSIQTDVYPPQKPTNSLGANFSSLIGTNVNVPTAMSNVVTEKSPVKPKKKKTKEDEDSTTTTESTALTNSKEIVENTVYADAYTDTNNMTLNIIAQSDELLRECKEDLDYIRSQRAMKGKYHYINATMASMSSLLSTKLAAIKEINSNIKVANDMEYRRFKDMNANQVTMDDNQAVMNAYSAFISPPIGAPAYQLPGTTNLTGGLAGVVRADYTGEVKDQMDAGFQNYLANMTPEEKIMMNDSTNSMEECIEYDEATGARRLVWYDNATGKPVPGMPASTNLALEEYTIDPISKTAKNMHIADVKNVKIVNSGAIDRF